MNNRDAVKPRLLLLVLMIAVLACSRGDQPLEFLGLELLGSPGSSGIKSSADTERDIEQDMPPVYTPTPDPVREPPSREDIPEWYTVQYGDSLNGIAGRMGVGANQILVDNGLPNADTLGVGQVLHLPTPLPQPPSPSFKIIPNAELVNGESALGYLTGLEVPEPDQIVVSGKFLEILEKDLFVLVPYGPQPVMIIKLSDGELRAFTAVCTHGQCNVRYRPEEADIYCGCHKGKFTEEGVNVPGTPPPRPLRKFHLQRQEDGTLLVSNQPLDQATQPEQPGEAV